MKKIVLSVVIGFSTFFSLAQDLNWSVEANYPLNVTSGSGFGEKDGILDLGIKNRFLDFGLIQLGAGLSTSFYLNNSDFTYGSQENPSVEVDFKSNSFLIQPKIFAELSLPGIPKLKPQIGLGYSLVIDYAYLKNGENVVFDETESDFGLNLNVGLSYDISKRLFIQIQYDYFNFARKGETNFDDITVPFDFKEDVGLLKAGLGLRF